MNHQKSLLIVLLTLLSAVVRAQTFYAADDSRIAYTGRISYRNPKAPAFTYPGITINATFTGTSIAMKAKPGCGHFMVELDDCEPWKVSMPEQDSVLMLASGLADTLHVLRLTYAHEGLTLLPVFYGLLTDAGRALGPRPELPVRSMEFIGNSITCGFGNEGDGTEKKHTWAKSNVYYAYEGYLTRALQAQCWIVARGGIGIYRNNNGNPKGDKMTLPAIYPYTLFGTQGEQWDFSCQQPDVVCINLGTNDTTRPSYDTDLLGRAYVDFLTRLREYYPQAQIVLLTGTMVSGQRLADIQQAQQRAIEERRAKGDMRIHRFDFTPADGTLGYGIFKHPSKRQHEQMARELEPFIRKLMGWE